MANGITISEAPATGLAFPLERDKELPILDARIMEPSLVCIARAVSV
jgi:hypothetical protein